jgi:hypothetical protein
MRPHINRLLFAGILTIKFFCVYPSDAQVNTLPESQKKMESFEQQLIGKWQLKFVGNNSEDLITDIIIAPMGQYLELSRSSKEAIRFSYIIDSSKRPPQILIEYGIGVFSGTIVGSKIELRLIKTKIPEYSKLIGKAFIQGRKLSSETSFPESIAVIDAADHYQRQVSIVKQSQASNDVSMINISQQTYFGNNQIFAPNLQVLERQEFFGVKKYSKDYNYQMFLSQDGRVVNIIAIPKIDKFKGYVGRVIIRQTKYGLKTPSIFCESISPTRQFPVLSNIEANNIQCPVGYEVPQTKSIRSMEFRTGSELGSINRFQISNYLENQKFTSDIQAIEEDLMNSGIKFLSTNYNYKTVISQEGRVLNTLARPNRGDLKSYIGRVGVHPGKNGVEFKSVVCESQQATQTIPVLPIFSTGRLQCPIDYKLLY